MKHQKEIEVLRKGPEFSSSTVFTEPEQVLAGFFSTSTIGLAINDRQLRFQAINTALASINGAPATAHIGKTVRDIFGTAATKIEPVLNRVLVGGQPVLNVEIIAKLPRRKEVGHFIGNYFPIKDPTGTVKQVRAFVVEVTQQKRLEQSLRNLTRTLLRIEVAERQRNARDIYDRLIKSNLGSDKTVELFTQIAELVEHCMLAVHSMRPSHSQYDIFKICPSTSFVTRVSSADELEEVKYRLASLASKHHADYFACEKSTGDIVARAYFLPVKSNAPRIKS